MTVYSRREIIMVLKPHVDEKRSEDSVFPEVGYFQIIAH